MESAAFICVQAPWPNPGQPRPCRLLQVIPEALSRDDDVRNREGVRAGLGVKSGGWGPKEEEMKS